MNNSDLLDSVINKTLISVFHINWLDEEIIDYIKLVFENNSIIFSIGSTGEDIKIIDTEIFEAQITRRGGMNYFKETNDEQLPEWGKYIGHVFIEYDIKLDKDYTETSVSLRFDNGIREIIALDDCLGIR